MKFNLLKTAITVAVSCFTINSFAQADTSDLEKMLDDGPKKKSYVTATFKSTHLIDGHTVENLGAGVLDFRISHRFGELNGGFHSFFGLDDANTRLGFDYGVTNWLMVGVGRSTFDKEYDGSVKIKLLRQTTDNRMPITLSYMGDISISDRDAPALDSGQTYHFSNRMYFVNQLLIARKFNNWLSLQLMPTLIHYNLVQKTSDPNDVFSLGVGGRVKVSNRVAITGEYYYVFNPMEGYNNALSFGVDIETGGHVFQLVFSNSRNLTERSFIGQTTGTWDNGDIHFGFNISRVFTIKKPKGTEDLRSKSW